jgi:radical SAM superfamily enzyme YgiQ (UPF0313 family)
MKILLAYRSGSSNRNDPYLNLVPTGLCYLHSCIKEAGHDSILANFSAWPASKIKKKLLSVKPDFVGISQWTHNRHSSLELANICRETIANCTIVLGGAHATFCYEEILAIGSPVDVVVRGEGESALIELLSGTTDWLDIAGLAFRHNASIVVTQQRKLLDNLDLLPLQSSYLESSLGIDPLLQAQFIVTSRGCPSKCFFCSSPDYWGNRVRFRSPEAIVEEIKFIRQKYGLIYFSIRDDTFTVNRKRILDFCNLLQKQKINILWNCQSRVTAIDMELLIEMKRAGCECIQLGVESGSPHILGRLGKNISPEQIIAASAQIRKVGINLSIYLISDVPGESDIDIQQTVDLIRAIGPDDGYVSPLAYYPGTRIYKEALSSGTIKPNIFSKSRKDALYATRTLGNSSVRLLKELTDNKRNDRERFARQKEDFGYIYTTNIIASEYYRQRTEYKKAENELLEITSIEPDNPWGWLLLGDLYFETGKISKGKKCYGKVISIVPQNSSAKTSLAVQ